MCIYPCNYPTDVIAAYTLHPKLNPTGQTVPGVRLPNLTQLILT
jgi:hypothetical protein